MHRHIKLADKFLISIIITSCRKEINKILPTWDAGAGDSLTVPRGPLWSPVVPCGPLAGYIQIDRSAALRFDPDIKNVENFTMAKSVK